MKFLICAPARKHAPKELVLYTYDRISSIEDPGYYLVLAILTHL